MKKVIQLIGQEGEHEGLFLTDRQDEDNFQEVFNECEKKAIEVENDNINSFEDAFTNYLSEEGFNRVFVTEVLTNLR